MRYTVKIKELPEDDRPREKLLRHGAASLSNSELLAILLSQGYPSVSALDLARLLLEKYKGVRGVSALDAVELLQEKGIGEAKASVLNAAFELSRRIEESNAQGLPTISEPGDAATLLLKRYGDKATEQFGILILDTKKQVKKTRVVSVGTLNASLVHPREVFRIAILEQAATLLLFHNHPSGDPAPSSDDIELTRRLCATGETVGIPVLDHLILARGRYISFKEQGLIG